MDNKEKLKKVIEQDINPNDCYNKIIKEIEREDKMKNEKKLWKWSLAPICLVAIMGFALLVNNGQLKTSLHKPNMETKENVNLYINDISKITQGTLKFDADIKAINVKNITYFKEIENLNIPSDFEGQDAYEIYVKSDQDKQEYNKLQNYVVNYSNTKTDRNIAISFSKENKPIRDYNFSEKTSKISKINSNELKIYKYDKTYFTEFNYKGINFDIETTNITERELTDLLLSIIK